MNRGYIDFCHLHRLADQGAFSDLRAWPDVCSMRERPALLTARFASCRPNHPVQFNGTGVPIIGLATLRRVIIYDVEQARRLAFWTNLWGEPAAVVAEAYRPRWQIELFCRWLKYWPTPPDLLDQGTCSRALVSSFRAPSVDSEGDRWCIRLSTDGRVPRRSGQ